MALSQSFPTPTITEPPRVVTNEAVGAPGLAFPLPVAPIAPDPFVPEASTPAKLITVIEESTDCDSVAVTVTPVKGVAEKARQISAVPSCALVLFTNTHVSPAPVTCVTVVLVEDTWSAEMNARRSSFPDVVEKAGALTLELGELWFFDDVASTLIAAQAGFAEKKLVNARIGRATLTNREIFFIVFFPVGKRTGFSVSRIRFR
jgi:hypothetical protein